METPAVQTPELLHRIDALRGTPVLVVGDSMLDRYVAGEVERISPEAPVPVVAVRREWSLLGGAGNVARNIAALGGKPRLVSVAGDDEDGRALAAIMDDAGIDHRLLTLAGRPTTVKTRILAGNQQVCRVDREDAGPLPPQALDGFFGLVAQAARGVGAVIVSDYGKGLVGPGFMDRLRAALGCGPAGQEAGGPVPPILVDPVPRNYDYYAGADLATPNLKEAGEGAGIRPDSQEAILRTGLALFRRLRFKHLLVTLGPQGMALFEKPDRVLHIPTFARKVYDVTGAGDTVIAVLGLALAAGLSLLEGCVLANHAAGVVVGQIGTAAVRPDELREAMRERPEPEVRRWL